MKVSYDVIETVINKLQGAGACLPLTTSRYSNIIRAPREPWVDIEFHQLETRNSKFLAALKERTSLVAR